MTEIPFSRYFNDRWVHTGVLEKIICRRLLKKGPVTDGNYSSNYSACNVLTVKTLTADDANVASAVSGINQAMTLTYSHPRSMTQHVTVSTRDIQIIVFVAIWTMFTNMYNMANCWGTVSKQLINRQKIVHEQQRKDAPVQTNSAKQQFYF